MSRKVTNGLRLLRLKKNRPVTRCWPALVLGLALVPGFATTGCQGLGMRGQGDMSFLDEDEEDDWYYPNRAQPKMTRPSPAEVASRMGREGRPRSVRISDAAISRYESLSNADQEQEDGAFASERQNSNSKSYGNFRPSPVVAYGQSEERAQDPSPPNNNLPNSLPTDRRALSTSEQDVDIDGALETLPPVYREILKKQLAIMQKQHGEFVSANGNPLRSMQHEAPIVSNDPNVDVHVQNNESKVREDHQNRVPMDSAQSVATDTTKKTGVSIRLNDTSLQDTASVQSNAIAALPATASVVTSKPNHPATTDSQVITASASSAQSLPIDVVPAGSTNVNSAMSPSAMTTASWKQGVGQAIELLEKQIKETPASDENLLLNQEITLRMLYVSQRRLEEALKPIDLLKNNESEQQFIHHQMMALYEASNPDAMPVRSRHWSLVMNSQREATNHLAAASNLEVKSLAFCTEVERYGVVTHFPKSIFQADQEILLYCEIENVAAEKVRNGYETQLQGSYEIIDSQGRKVADQLLPMEPELCQNHRRDYFIVYKIYMPPQIASGNYQLRFTVEDMKARKFGQSQLDFSIKK